MTTGTSATRAALRTVREHPRLAVFPAVAALVTLASAPALLWALTGGVEGASIAVAGGSGAAARSLFPLVLALAVMAVTAVLSGVLAFCNAALVAATADLVDLPGDDAMDDPSGTVDVTGAFGAALRAWRTVLAYALVTGAGGLVLGIAERVIASDGRSGLFAAIMGAPYAALTYLLGPVAVLEGTAALRSFRRSAELVEQRFGAGAVPSVGILWDAILVGAVPLVLLQTALIADALVGANLVSGGVREAVAPVAAVALAVLWIAVVAGSALGAVGKTALYLAIEEGLSDLPLLDLDVRTYAPEGDRPGVASRDV